MSWSRFYRRCVHIFLGRKTKINLLVSYRKLATRNLRSTSGDRLRGGDADVTGVFEARENRGGRRSALIANRERGYVEVYAPEESAVLTLLRFHPFAANVRLDSRAAPVKAHFAS